MVISMKRWENKVAVVTGASSGIGAAICEQLVKYSVIVVGLARRVDKIEELSKTLTDKKGKLYGIKTDITNEDEIHNAFKTITAKYGPVHILINNSGVSTHGGLTNSPTEEWKKMIDVNILGLSIVTREAYKIMDVNKINGHIIHINSIAGHSVPNFPGINIYPATKHAVTALTEILRQELVHLKSKVKITSVSPGLVATEMTTLAKDAPAERKESINHLPILKAEDIADGVIYVLSTPEYVQVHELTIKPVGEPF